MAQLKRPTTRRTLALLRELLEAQGRPDLNEAALTVMGSAHMSRADVQALLDQSVIAFDRAAEVYQTPTPYGFSISAHQSRIPACASSKKPRLLLRWSSGSRA